MKSLIMRRIERHRKMFAAGAAAVLSALLLTTLLWSCSPPAGGDESPQTTAREISIAYLKSLYSDHPMNIAVDYSIKGVVVSTDRHTNFYKTLVISDQTAGIEIKVDMEKLFREFMPGQELKVHCNGLTIGAYGGLVQLGAVGGDGRETGYIDRNVVTAHLRVTGQLPKKPEAQQITIGELSDRQLSCLVRIWDVQFVEEESGLSWCEPDVDTERHIVDCEGEVLAVRTSRRAEFASWLLPAGNGYIEGILSCFNGEYFLKVSDPQMANMNGERF